MKSSIHWRHALVAPLVLVLLLSLAFISPVHAAKKPNRNNNNRAKIEQIRRQMAAQAAAQARILGKQIQGLDARIKVNRQDLSSNREYQERAAPPMQMARSQNEAAKLHVTSAKLELNELEDEVLDAIPPRSPYLAQKSTVIKARTRYEEARNKAETQVDFFVKGVEKEKQITAVPAVQQAQRVLKRAADLVDMEKKNILRASPSWTGAWGRLNDRNNESEGTQKKLDQTVSVYNKYRIAGNKAARELNSNLKKKQVLVVQKHAAEQMARQYGYYQRPGSKGSGSSQSPGSKGR